MSWARIRPKRDISANWVLANPILLEGELGIEYPNDGIGTGLVKAKLGDGIKHWNDLEYAIDGSDSAFIHGGDSVSSKDIWIRSDDHDTWYYVDPVLGNGELVFDKTYKCFKVGDGVHRYSELNFIGFTQNETRDPDIHWDFGDEDAIPNDSTLDEDFGDEDE